jgi:hypothetical protein
MARSKGTNSAMPLKYASKVSRSIAGIVGDKYAEAIAFAGIGKWAENTPFLEVAKETYKEIAHILTGNANLDKAATKRYLSLATALAAQFWTFYNKYDNGIPEERLDDVAVVFAYNPKMNLKYEHAQTIVKLFNDAFKRVTAARGG